MGCRVLKVAPGLIEGVLRKGMEAIEPIDVPKDLEVLSARMNFAIVNCPVIELLVRSADFNGDDSATFDTAESWTATFRRTAVSGKDAKRGK